MSAHAQKYNVQKREFEKLPDLLPKIGDFVSRVSQESDRVKIANETMGTIGEIFKATEMIMALWNEDLKRFKLLSSYGYSPNVEREILKFEYSDDWITKELQEKFRIAEDIYYINAEDWDPVEVDEFLIDQEERMKPREAEDYWHEQDFFEFILRDHEGKIVGAMELNDSATEGPYLPDLETLMSISIFVKIGSILFENANMRAMQREITNRMEGMTSLMSHDLGNALDNTLKLLKSIQRQGVDKEFRSRVLKEVNVFLQKARDVIKRVQKLRSIDDRARSIFAMTDIMKYFRKSAEELEKTKTDIKVNMKNEKSSILMKCDPSLQELFSACFEVVAQMKKGIDKEIMVEISERTPERELEEIVISFTSGDIDYANWHRLAIDLRSVGPGLRRLPSSDDMFIKYMITSTIKKYGGKAWVDENPIAGGHVRGALYISLPKL